MATKEQNTGVLSERLRRSSFLSKQLCAALAGKEFGGRALLFNEWFDRQDLHPGEFCRNVGLGEETQKN